MVGTPDELDSSSGSAGSQIRRRLSGTNEENNVFVVPLVEETDSVNANTVIPENQSRAGDTNQNPKPKQPPPEKQIETEPTEIILPCEGLPSIRLSWFQKFAIASGHFQNDLCAALWFSYLLLYFEKVVGFSTGTAVNNFPGTLMLIGQVVDGISTPIVGYEVDHTHIRPYNYGRCKSWHLWGSAMVLVSFPFIFSPVIGGSPNTAAWVKFVYYVPFIAIFQIGWASVQISHLAIIPKMHPDELVRTELFSIRYAFTVVANISIFAMTYVNLRLQQINETDHDKCAVDKSDTGTFMFISLAAVGLGIVSTLLFHLGVYEENDMTVKRKVAAINSRTALIRRMSQMSEDLEPAQLGSHPPASSAVGRRFSYGSLRSGSLLLDDEGASQRGQYDDRSVEERQVIVQSALAEIEAETQIAVTSNTSVFSTNALSIGKEVMKIRDWLALPQTYMVAFMYMATRLSINLGQVYIPFYLQESLRIECTSLALIPFTMYISGFHVSIIVKFLNRKLGRQLSYVFGATLECIGCILILTLDWDGPQSVLLKGYAIYGVAILLGAGASAILVTSLSITADLIGNNIESGAFVYGMMSFCDKVSAGLAIVFIDSLVPCSSTEEAETTCNPTANILFYEHVVAYSIGGCALFGVFGVILLTFYILKQNRIGVRRILSQQND